MWFLIVLPKILPYIDIPIRFFIRTLFFSLPQSIFPVLLLILVPISVVSHFNKMCLCLSLTFSWSTFQLSLTLGYQRHCFEWFSTPYYSQAIGERRYIIKSMLELSSSSYSLLWIVAIIARSYITVASLHSLLYHNGNHLSCSCSGSDYLVLDTFQ